MDINLFIKALSSQERAAILLKLQTILEDEKKQAKELELLKLKNQPEETFGLWFFKNINSMSTRLKNALTCFFKHTDEINCYVNAGTPITDITLKDVSDIRNIGTSSLMEFKKLRGY